MRVNIPKRVVCQGQRKDGLNERAFMIVRVQFEMLLHVVNHKTYHRGYVAQMLYQASVRPPTMDLPVFLRDVPLVL